jgi:integrase
MDQLSATIEDGVNFLAELYKEGIGYSALNTARSALSTTLMVSDSEVFGTHPLVSRFMKGVFETRPSLPRYGETWDVNVVLDYLSGLGPPEEQTFKMLTYKVVMLLALLSGQRRQTMHALDISTMQLSLNKCTFVIKSLLKTSRPGKHLTSVEFKSYTLDRNLCPVAHISEYIKRTELLRGNQHKLFISVQKPYKEVSADTISRWLKTTLALAGIDIAKFGAHSTRSASTSAAKAMNIPIDIIMQNAGWSQESTFAKYYLKPIAKESYGNLLLQNRA